MVAVVSSCYFFQNLFLWQIFSWQNPCLYCCLLVFIMNFKGGESVLPLLGIIWQYLMHMRYDWKERCNFDSVDTDGFLDPKLWGVVNSHFFSRTNSHQARPILVLFLMAKGEILISVDTDGFPDPKLWGVVNSHFFSRTNGHQARPILVLFLSGQRWIFYFLWHRWIPWPEIVGSWLIRTFSLGPTDTKLDPFWCFFLMAEGEILIPLTQMDSLTQNCGGGC